MKYFALAQPRTGLYSSSGSFSVTERQRERTGTQRCVTERYTCPNFVKRKNKETNMKKEALTEIDFKQISVSTFRSYSKFHCEQTINNMFFFYFFNDILGNFHTNYCSVKKRLNEFSTFKEPINKYLILITIHFGIYLFKIHHSLFLIQYHLILQSLVNHF